MVCSHRQAYSLSPEFWLAAVLPKKRPDNFPSQFDNIMAGIYGIISANTHTAARAKPAAHGAMRPPQVLYNVYLQQGRPSRRLPLFLKERKSYTICWN